jgi:Family of unknown function (DUF6088)
MQSLSKLILNHAQKQPEGMPISAKGLLHLGTRVGVDKALSRLAEQGQLLKAGRGLYLLPVQNRFGARAPTIESALKALATQRGEVFTTSGAAAANALGLTKHVPVRSVYLTSGRTRTLMLGKQSVELRHAPRWQLALAGSPAGEVVRALAWLGPREVETSLQKLKQTLPPSTFGELALVAPQLPTWLALGIGRVAYG